MISLIPNDNIAKIIYCYSRRILELRGPIPLGSKFEQETAVVREYLNSVVEFIADNNISILMDCDKRRKAELAIFASFLLGYNRRIYQIGT